jgi:hypothetical protein
MSTRKSIRDNIVTRLKAATPVTAITSTRIEVGRVNVTDSGTWPRIYLYTEREEIENDTLSVARQQYRRMTLLVDFWRKQGTGVLDDELDDAADKISTAVTADTTCGGFAKDTLLTSLEYTQEGSEEVKFGIARLTFSIIYLTRES